MNFSMPRIFHQQYDGNSEINSICLQVAGRHCEGWHASACVQESGSLIFNNEIVIQKPGVVFSGRSCRFRNGKSIGLGGETSGCVVHALVVIGSTWSKDGKQVELKEHRETVFTFF